MLTLVSPSLSISLCDWQAPGSAPQLIKNHHIIPAVSQYLNINTGGTPSPLTWWRRPTNELHHYEEALTRDGGMRGRWREGAVEYREERSWVEGRWRCFNRSARALLSRYQKGLRSWSFPRDEMWVSQSFQQNKRGKNYQGEEKEGHFPGLSWNTVAWWPQMVLTPFSWGKDLTTGLICAAFSFCWCVCSFLWYLLIQRCLCEMCHSASKALKKDLAKMYSQTSSPF